jgi:hypothetical protein
MYHLLSDDRVALQSSLERAVMEDPDDKESWSNLGCLLFQVACNAYAHTHTHTLTHSLSHTHSHSHSHSLSYTHTSTLDVCCSRWWGNHAQAVHCFKGLFQTKLN